MSDGKMAIKNFLVVFALVYIAFVLQTSVFNHFELAGISPNLILVITVAFGYLKGSRAGIVVGFISGLLLDIFIGSYFGMNALILMYIGYLNGLIRLFYFGEDIKFPIVLLSLSDVLYGLTVFAVLFLMRERYDYQFYFKAVIIPEAIYTVIVGMVVYTVTGIAIRWADKPEKRATREIA